MPRRGENIYKRKDGRWEGRICGPDGRYQYVYAKTYREVKEKKNEYQKAAKKSKKNAPPDSAAHLFECWLDGDIKGQVKPSTYDSYDCCIRKYVIPFFNSAGHQHLDEASINQLVKSVFELPGLSDSYKRKILTILKTSLKEILKDTKMSPGILDAVKLPKKTNSEVQAFTMGEQRLIENAAYRSDDMRALGILLTFYTGMRLGELCALKWNDLDYESGTLSITKTVTRVKNLSGGENKTVLLVGSPKSHKSTRKIPLPKFLIKLFRDREPCCADQELYLISGTTSPTDPRVYEKLFKRMLMQAGIKHRKFHAIRHTFATRALELGVDIKTLSEILGHSNVSITLNVYAHSLMEQKKIAMDKLNTLHVTYMGAAPYAVIDSVVNI
ncbi:Tyrosine recombinase XerC [bioreactor metagenome]|uniref:Tyrosine recombinase XerC n=1 Tax=bioreactor metagenome TaxID=1076179 RepID=A0A645CGY3_9ZZZZ